MSNGIDGSCVYFNIILETAAWPFNVAVAMYGPITVPTIFFLC